MRYHPWPISCTYWPTPSAYILHVRKPFLKTRNRMLREEPQEAMYRKPRRSTILRDPAERGQAHHKKCRSASDRPRAVSDPQPKTEDVCRHRFQLFFSTGTWTQ